MAKRGKTNHLKRIAVPPAVPIHDKKANVWMTNSDPGPHSKSGSIPLSVFMRDVLKIVKTAGEAKTVLYEKNVFVDGKCRTNPKFPVGLMDVVSFPSVDKYYRIVVDWKGRLIPREITKTESVKKILKVTGKRTVPGGKIGVKLHDGRTMIADNHLKVGDSVSINLPEGKLENNLKLEKGATCLIREGNHAGVVAVLDEIIERKVGTPNEARLKTSKGDFITVAKYLVVVDKDFKVIE